MLAWAFGASNKSDNVYIGYQSQHKLECFCFDACNSTPSIVTRAADPEIEIFNNIYSNGMFLEEKKPINNVPGDDRLTLFNTGICKIHISQTTENTLFKKTPGYFQILPNHYKPSENYFLPFFYRNEINNFYVNYTETRRPVTDDFSVDNAGYIMARRSFSPVNLFPVTTTGSNGTTMNHTLPSLHDDFNIDLLNGVNEVIEPEPAKIVFGKKYIFQSFYHPFVCDYISRINTRGN